MSHDQITKPTDHEMHRRRATILDVVGALFIVAGIAFVVVGLLREGTPNVYAGVSLVAALALRAHAEVLRLRGVVHEVIARVGSEL